MANASKLKNRKFLRLISTFVEVTGKKMVGGEGGVEEGGGGFLPLPPSWIGLTPDLLLIWTVVLLTVDKVKCLLDVATV